MSDRGSLLDAMAEHTRMDRLAGCSGDGKEWYILHLPHSAERDRQAEPKMSSAGPGCTSEANSYGKH